MTPADPFHGRIARERTPEGATIRRVPQNPAGALDALFVIDGDFAHARIASVHAPTPGDIPPDKAPARRLRIFHVNDLHNHLCDFTRDGTRPRLSRIVRHVRRARDAAGPDEAVLFLSAGDDHTGTVLDELVGWGADDFVLDPGFRALSAAGVDAAAIGNHEFDRGSAQLVRGIEADAHFPLLSANIHSSARLIPGQHYHAALLAVAKSLRIGIIGLTTRVETRVGQPSDPGMAVASPVAALAHIMPLLADLSDVVIVLSHCGYGDGNHLSGKAAVARDIGEADFALARTAAALTEKPTVLIGAHTHTRLNETGTDPANLRDGILITQAECNGRYLGEIVVETGTTTPVEARLIPIPASDGETSPDHDAAFEAAVVAPIVARVAERMNRTVGMVTGGGLDWEATRLARYASECAIANLVNDGIVARLATLPSGAPDLAMINGASLLAGLDPGPVAFARLFDVMPYSDEIYLVTATGRQIADMLRSNARRILRPEEQAAVDPDGFVARGFLHVSAALRYRIRLGASAATASATGITIGGAPIEDRLDDRFTIAMTTYLALGSFGERWNGAALAGGLPPDLPGFDMRSLPATNTGLIYRNELTAFFASRPSHSARLDGRLVVVPG